MIEYCSFSAAECGGRVTGQSGVIESSGYPTLPYADDLFCEWHLQGPSGHYLTIRFEGFSLQDSSGCERDFVEIWENHTSGQWDTSAVFWGYLFSQVTHSASEISSFPSKARLFFFFCGEVQISQLWTVPGFLSLSSYPWNSGAQSPGALYSLSWEHCVRKASSSRETFQGQAQMSEGHPVR